MKITNQTATEYGLVFSALTIYVVLLMIFKMGLDLGEPSKGNSEVQSCFGATCKLVRLW